MSSMGFPVRYSKVFFPNLFLEALSLLGFIRNLIFFPNLIFSLSQTSFSQHLIREFLPVMKVQDIMAMPASESYADLKWIDGRVGPTMVR